MRALALLVSLLAASCSAPIREREFRVEAINTEEEPVSCVIYLGDELLLDATRAPVVTPATLRVDFRNESGGSGGVKVHLHPVKVDGGRIVRGLGANESSPYFDDTRYLHRLDAPKQVFILRRNKTYLD